MQRARHLLLLYALCLPACGSDPDKIGIPQPDPIPRPSLLRSTGLPELLEGPIDLVGLPGTVGGTGLVSIKGSRGQVEVTATDTGSFAAGLTALAEEVLEIRYKSSEPASFEVPLLGIMAPQPPGPDPFMTSPPISAPVGGITTIHGMTSANSDVIAVNFHNGAVATGTSDATGIFDLQVAASSGDEVRTYLHGNVLGAAWIQTVP